MTETKRERFIRVAENRTNKIIKTMRLLGNCANKANYDYTDEDAKKIIHALEEELNELIKKFTNESKKKKPFKLT
ncbi:hypothetical protein [Caldibacillus debilis]|jgi:ABC-type Fe3+-hydroxamate transport system substrate-binding protein|uniref:Histidine kinase n=1 Tax=Caldibacillus debilis TaxID=301148 RepID=A0A150MC13_9BACI|nr:hypothetical protein [Caldibacillus debilis]KYD22006.1 hypothetical protein B4135_1511 [Caldibacillus debilis]